MKIKIENLNFLWGWTHSINNTNIKIFNTRLFYVGLYISFFQLLMVVLTSPLIIIAFLDFAFLLLTTLLTKLANKFLAIFKFIKKQFHSLLMQTKNKINYYLQPIYKLLFIDHLNIILMWFIIIIKTHFFNLW